MWITIRYFASLKERVGKSDDTLEITLPLNASELWNVANPDYAMPEHTLIAINMEYVSSSHPLHVDDEVAFFPPVTGG